MVRAVVCPVDSGLRKALTLLFTLVMFGALLPAGTATPPASPPDTLTPAPLPSGALLTFEDGHVQTDQLGGILDPRRFVGEQGIHIPGLVGTVRDAVAHQGGLLVPTPASLGSEAGGSSHDRETERYALPGGDFDGDGLAEFLDYAVDLDGLSTTISAVDGDGTFLWSQNYTAEDGHYGAFPAYVTDLDGDQIDEVVVLSLRFHEDSQEACAVVYCTWTTEFDGTWDLEVLEGPNGNIRWTHSTPTHVSAEQTETWVSFVDARALKGEGTGIWVLPMLGDDADGDGSPDLVVMQSDGEVVVASGRTIFTGAMIFYATYTTHYRILGSDGQPTLTGSLAPAHDVSFVLPAGDIDGDGLSDLLTVEGVGGSGVLACVLLCTWSEADPFLRMSGLSGTDGSTLWTSEHPNVATERSFVDATDLTGDGVADPLFIAAPWISGHEMEAYDGANGDLLYSILSPAYEPYAPTGDLDGDGGADLVTVYPEGVVGVIGVRAVSGATGATLWSTPVFGNGIHYVEYAGIYSAGDADGDGAPDLLLNMIGEGTHDWIEASMLFDSTGTVRWTQEGFFMSPGADVDGDGGADPIAQRSEWTGGSRWTMAVASGATGDLLWSRVEEFAHPISHYLESSPDLDGDGSGDLLQSITGHLDQGSDNRVRAHSGANGEILLEYSGFKAPDPPAYAQDDAGSGGDAGDDTSTALFIAPGDHTGRLDPDHGDHDDYYAVNVSAGDHVRIIMDPGAIDHDLYVYDPNGTYLDGSSGYRVEEVSFTAGSDGAHYVRVRSSEWSAGNYTLSVSIDIPTTPPVVDPRTENATFAGHIGCGVSALMIRTADLCSRIDANSVSTFAFPVDVGVTGLHVEMRWEDGAVLPAERLRIDWLMPGAAGAQGTSPLILDTDVDTASTTHNTADELHLSVRVGQDQGAVVGQAFEGCVTILYGGAELPEGSCFDA